MDIWKNVLWIAAGIALISYIVNKVRELNDDYRYFNQDVQRYIDK